MAKVTLSDVIDIEVYQDLPAVNSPETTAFYQSGIVVNSPQLNEFANAPSATGELPFWTDINASSEPNYTDDSDTEAGTDKVSQESQKYRVAYVNKGFAAKDLVSELTMGAEALQHVRNRIDTYWQRQWQRRLIAAAQGVLADNVANDSGDMVYSAYSDISSPTSANKFSLANFNSAVIGSLGDAFESLSVVAMHSAVYHTMVDNNEAEDIRNSDGTLLYRAYKGLRIVIDDGLPVTSGTNSDKYLCILFGSGAFAYGQGSPQVPLEIERSAKSGNGGGEEEFWTRKTWLLHPGGFQHTGTPSGQSFTLAELRAATSWDRVIERKNIPLAFLEVNV